MYSLFVPNIFANSERALRRSPLSVITKDFGLSGCAIVGDAENGIPDNSSA